jgi:hypothetical protein
MRSTDESVGRRWRAAVLGSAIVSISIAMVFWVVENSAVATIMALAVVTIALIALFGSRRTCS